MPADQFLFFPLNRQGQGSGHMRRCYKTASAMGDEAVLILDEDSPESLSVEILSGQIAGFSGSLSIAGKWNDCISLSANSSDVPGFSHSLAILDRRNTTRAEMALLAGTSSPVLIDDDGSARKSAPFLIDTIPGPRKSSANVSSPRLLDLPDRERNPDLSSNILVSFGGQDPTGLLLPVLENLQNSILFADGGSNSRRIDVTVPMSLDENLLPDFVTILKAPGNLQVHLRDYGLVICSYGLTAWEALAAGCAVLTVDPSRYHARLSAAAGLPGTGRMRISSSGKLSRKSARKLEGLLRDGSALVRRSNTAYARFLDRKSTDNPGSRSGSDEFSGYEGNLPDILSSLEAPRPVCTACGSSFPDVVMRFPRRSYYHCAECGITGMYRFNLKEDEYGAAYFQSEYKSQYGRSYLEDFDFIRSMASPRLRQIARKGSGGGTLLDIGCAFGPFLSAAREAGFEPNGCDVSSEGISYVRDELGIPAVCSRFPEENPASALGVETFDVVTLWYVIEHFADLETVLGALNRMLKERGVLALSTPNGAGISARRSLRGFLDRSPADHYSIWTPGSARKLLARHGFKVYKIRITGHHPERFPGSPQQGTILYRLFGVLSRIFGLGDTFEVYSLKEQAIG